MQWEPIGNNNALRGYWADLVPHHLTGFGLFASTRPNLSFCCYLISNWEDWLLTFDTARGT